jgi:CubicO group peptidase (beta-lactamase class C family)
MAEVQISGRVEPGFEAVRAAFEANFHEQGEVGAAFCLYAGGRPVVDLVGGAADPESGTPYTPDTLQLVFSTTKAAAALCAHVLAERGELDLDAPVRTYWPEFSANGKERIPVRWLLSHRAGVPTVDAQLTLEQLCEVTPVVQALAEQKPYWEPGTAHGYHALTFGWLVGEVVRRVTGRTIGTWFADEVAKPLGLDFHIGLPESEEARVAPLQPVRVIVPEDPEVIERMMVTLDPNHLMQRALTLNGAMSFGIEEGRFDAGSSFNRRDVHATEMPAANGITTAASLARMYAATFADVDGVRLLSEGALADARRLQAEGPDAVLVEDTRFASGFFLDGPACPMLGPASYGHSGAGGSLGFADTEAGVAFGYVMNQMNLGLGGDPRAVALVEAVRRSL